MRSTAPTRTASVPAPVQWARVLLAGIAISHLAVAVTMWGNRGALRDQIASQHPDFGAAQIARSTDVAVTSGAAFHGALLVLCALLAWKLATGRPWTRRVTTISQLVSVVFAVVSWSSSPMFHAIIPVVSAAEILAVALLWISRPVQDFFAGHSVVSAA